MKVSSSHPPLEPLATSLSVGQAELLHRWLANIVIRGVQTHMGTNSLAIVSSHAKRRNYESCNWQNKMRAALRFARERDCVVFYNSLSPYSDVLHRACVLFGVRWVRVVATSKKFLRDGDLEKPNLIPESSNEGLPEVTLDVSGVSTSLLKQGLAFAIDQFLIAACNQVFALEVREGGKIVQALSERLKTSDIEPTSIKVASGSTVVSRLTSLGAVEWICLSPSRVQTVEGVLFTRGSCSPYQHQSAVRAAPGTDNESPPDTVGFSTDRFSNLSNSQKLTKSGNKVTYQPIMPLSKWHPNTGWTSKNWSYLSHCTRAREGRWPDQSSTAYLDELILLGGIQRNSPLVTLVRILSMKTILATSIRKPGEFASVSFTAQPPPILFKKRRFEKHLGRWDWEPYGIMIRRDILENRNALPVLYRTKDEMSGLCIEDLRRSQIYSEDGSSRDWRDEMEWRFFGNCELSDISSTEAIVFVRTLKEAQLVSMLSHWPVLYINN